ncbi:putative glycosyltransferase [Caenibius tardaugens NBRC 16725]|uniref:Putative glycosyltransferase n=1 Tax=Caenibius tardaugens NBRC 16725 TaxID=1219035 RepID=U2YI10_9SPHN|nr:glycosyltransferase family 1 protein [Caenibius tardaugens]AZI38312.1 glycosyltransferase family 1 protein [Caenibius tardaugens NBRC 16725]GAD47865.1 putative glycosyltransferase [Caenibius tardaugens NBRC 16725]
MGQIVTEISQLRIALFSGNYNYVRDGANQALNRLVDYLLRQGAQVRVYAPVVENPAFEATGTLIGIPSMAIPRRKEYRFPLGLSNAARRDLEAFAPNVLHVSSPDVTAHRAVGWARQRGIPILASVHTRFETYMRYYGLGFTEPLLEAIMRRFYRRCDAVVAPSESMAQVLREQRMGFDISIWSRGVDRDIFQPAKRDSAWRQSFGIADNDVVIGFLGRLVMEKGLDVFSDTMDELRRANVPHKILIVGDGPARGWLENRLPGTAFAGFQSGADLGRAVASMDVLFNPSVTETFGNVTLEAMACGLPVVAAAATGSESLVADSVSGRLIRPGAIHNFAEALRTYIENPELRRAHGQAGETRSQEFDWDRINHTVAETYLRLVRQKSPNN